MTSEPWVIAFRRQVKIDCGKGWTVTPDKGHVRIRYRVTGQPVETVTLPYAWHERSTTDALLRIRQIHNAFAAGGVDLQGAARIASLTSSRHETDWEAALTVFREHRRRVAENTWKRKYQPVLNAAIQALSGRNAPTNGTVLCDAALSRWEPGARQRQIMRQNLHAFLRYCVERRHFKPCWLPPPVDDTEHVRPKRVGYPLTDGQILRLLGSLPSTDTGRRWAFAIQLLAVYGLRPEDLRHLHTRHDGAELWSRYQKSQGGRRGARTEPRRLFPLPVHDVDGPIDWKLQQHVHIGEELPPLGQPGKAGEALGTYLKRQPVWRSLAVEAEAEGQQLTPYSFRHRYSAAGHQRGVGPKQLADAMGHSLEVHMGSYARFMSRDLEVAFNAVNGVAAAANAPVLTSS